jgi:hypothetical protein
MAVHVVQGNNKSWLDYAGPIVMKLIGDGIDRTQQAKAYELAKRTEEEAMARRQQEAQWRAEQLYGVEKSRQLSGPDQALNVAGYTPGGQLPATDETYREGGILNGLDMRGDRNDAFGRIAAGMQYMDPETAKQMQYMFGSLNPNMEFQTIDQGDRAFAGAFNPANGELSGQEYMYGTNPTKQYEADKTLEGILAQVMGNRDVARINASRPYAPKASQIMQGPNGEILFADPYGQTVTPSGVNGLIPKQSGQAGQQPDIKSLVTLRGQLIDDLSHRPIAGMEGIVAQIDEALKSLAFGGGQMPPEFDYGPNGQPGASQGQAPLEGILPPEVLAEMRKYYEDDEIRSRLSGSVKK